jgi:2-keto-3-deoxy-L-rhamnonate aldolase RhmA
MEAIQTSSLRDRIRAREWLVGTVVSSSDPLLAEQVASVFDFVWIDLEHSALSLRDVQMLAIAAEVGGAGVLVRLPRFDSELLTAVLDMGLDGVVAPKVSTRADAELLAESLRYPPAGSRGFAPRRLGRARPVPAPADARVVCIAQIETREGVANAGAIAAVEGIDAVVVGTSDLSFELGVPLQFEAPPMVAAIEAVGRQVVKVGGRWGAAAGALHPWVRRLPQQGASLVLFSSDVRLYAEAIDRGAALLRDLPETADNR